MDVYGWKSIHGHPLHILSYTRNANMADHSVGTGDESCESEASQALMFCFDKASQEKSNGPPYTFLCSCIRAQNNGRSPDNVPPIRLFVRTKFGFGGHFDPSHTVRGFQTIN